MQSTAEISKARTDNQWTEDWGIQNTTGNTAKHYIKRKVELEMNTAIKLWRFFKNNVTVNVSKKLFQCHKTSILLCKQLRMTSK